MAEQIQRQLLRKKKAAAVIAQAAIIRNRRMEAEELIGQNSVPMSKREMIESMLRSFEGGNFL